MYIYTALFKYFFLQFFLSLFFLGLLVLVLFLGGLALLVPVLFCSSSCYSCSSSWPLWSDVHSMRYSCVSAHASPRIHEGVSLQGALLEFRRLCSIT